MSAVSFTEEAVVPQKGHRIDSGSSLEPVRIFHRESRGSGSVSGTTLQTTRTASTMPPYAEIGAPINRSETAEARKESNGGLHWSRIRRLFREPFSEFMGTFVSPAIQC